MREAHYNNEKGRFVGSMCVDQGGKAVVNCKTLLHLPSPSILMLPSVKVVEEEVHIAVVDIGLLH